ncbi:MAG: pilus assembly protein [Oligoflexia bacterium]|nr:pilus assembly protein [Oligoflexia bacterium]
MKKKSESGQAIIEFLIVSTLIITLMFVFIQVAWAIAFGHYAHYATYMASRSMLSGGVSRTDQTDAAEEVLRATLNNASGNDLIKFLARSRGGDERDASGPEPITGTTVGTHPYAAGKENSRLYSWAEGVQYNFGVKMFLIPLASFIAKEGEGESIQAGTATEPAKPIEWKGYLQFTSDAFLGRESTVDECQREMTRISSSIGINRGDGNEFIQDNGC